MQHYFEDKQRTAWELYTTVLERITRHTSLVSFQTVPESSLLSLWQSTCALPGLLQSKAVSRSHRHTGSVFILNYECAVNTVFPCSLLHHHPLPAPLYRERDLHIWWPAFMSISAGRGLEGSLGWLEALDGKVVEKHECRG